MASQGDSLLDARGRPLIRRRGVERGSLAADAYHVLRTASWPKVFLIFAALFAVSNVAFGLLVYVTGAHVANAHGLLDDIWFSVQTIATIGYGTLAPDGHVANLIVFLESFYSIMLTALATGVIFSRFSTPSARVLFSHVALVTEHDSQRVLMFRMANQRATAIVEATVRLYLTRDETLANGEPMRRVHDLRLRRSTTPVFALSFLAVHIIDDTSPLFGVTPESLRAADINIVATFTGIDDLLASTVHSRYVWASEDVQFDRTFVDIFVRDPDGARVLDLAPMHTTQPLSAARPASPG